jgi:hypothetical protein
MAVHEFKPFAADGSLERTAHPLEEGVPQHVLADQVFEIGVMVSHHVGGPHPGKSVKQVHVTIQDFADIGLPEIENVTEQKKLPTTVLNVIQKVVEFPQLSVNREIVPRAAVTQVQITGDKYIFFDGHYYIRYV